MVAARRAAQTLPARRLAEGPRRTSDAAGGAAGTEGPRAARKAVHVLPAIRRSVVALCARHACRPVDVAVGSRLAVRAVPRRRRRVPADVTASTLRIGRTEHGREAAGDAVGARSGSLLRGSARTAFRARTGAHYAVGTRGADRAGRLAIGPSVAPGDAVGALRRFRDTRRSRWTDAAEATEAKRGRKYENMKNVVVSAMH